MLAASGAAGARGAISTRRGQAIGAAVFLDGLDGRIARMTNTISDFGREMDSLADVISFGIAPAVLAFAWGVQFVDAGGRTDVRDQLTNAGYFIAFLFLLCGRRAWRASTFRRTRFPRIPAGRTASISSACRFPPPPPWWPRWCMPSTREPIDVVAAFGRLAGAAGAARISHGQHLALLQLQGHQSDAAPIRRCIIIVLGALIYSIWNYSQPVLLAMAAAYVASGIVIRIGGILRRRLRHAPHPPALRSTKLAESTHHLALVGSETLLGREIRDIVATGAPGDRAAADRRRGRGVGRAHARGRRTGRGRPGSTRGNSRAAPARSFWPVRAESSRKALELAGDPPDAAIIDLTVRGRGAPGRAPARAAGGSRRRRMRPRRRRARDRAPGGHRAGAVPAPPAIARPDPARAVVQIFAPASEHGTAGVEELQQQTVSLLSFKTLPQAIFDTQAELQPAGALRRGGARRRSKKRSCASSATWPPCWPCRATAKARPCPRCG